MDVDHMGNTTSLEKIQYQCDNCGVEATAIGKVPRCLGCGKELCEICNRYFLCPQDYNLLNQRHKKKVKRLASGLDSAKSAETMFKVFPLGLAIAGGVLLVLLVVLKSDTLNFIFGFLGGFLLLGALMMFGVFHNLEERETKRINREIRGIITSYNIPAWTGSKGETTEPTTVDETGEKEHLVIVCAECGASIQGVDLKYCERCGAPLNR